MIIDYQRSTFIATSMNTHHVWSMIIEIAMNTDRQWSLIITDIVEDQWSLLWNAVDHTWSVLINASYREPYHIGCTFRQTCPLFGEFINYVKLLQVSLRNNVVFQHSQCYSYLHISCCESVFVTNLHTFWHNFSKCGAVKIRGLSDITWISDFTFYWYFCHFLCSFPIFRRLQN